MKKRYAFTLTEGRVEALQDLVKEMNLPPVTVSMIVDDIMSDFMESVAPMLRRAKAGEKITLADMFGMIGKQIDKMVED